MPGTVQRIGDMAENDTENVPALMKFTFSTQEEENTVNL